MAQYLNAFSGRQFIDANGNPYVGAKLFIYAAGSSTKVTTTKDSAGASNHTNPIILNARGEPADGAGASQAIWQTAGSATKLVLAPSNDTDPPVSAISTWDNLSGINDSSSGIDQWVNGPTPTFVSTTQFTLVGDQTTNFHVGRRIKASVTAGTVYGTITVTAYTTLTTVTVVLDSGALDSGLSAVLYGLLTVTNPAIPEGIAPTWRGVHKYTKSVWYAEGANVASTADCNIWAAGDGNTVHVTGSVTITTWGTAPQAGAWMWVIFDGTPQLTYNATTNKLNSNATNYTVVAGDRAYVYAESTTSYVVTIIKLDGTSLIGSGFNRQQFDANGTWTKPAGYLPTSIAVLECWSPGGGGASGDGGGITPGGGGGGSYVTKTVLLSDMGATEAITVPVGGAGGISGGGNGAAGARTIIGSIVGSYGGGGGSQSTLGGAGGGGGGDFAVGADASAATPGSGGSGIGGGGGSGGASTVDGSIPNSPYGGGGGGGQNANGAKAVWGGGGGAGGAGTKTGGVSINGGSGGNNNVSGSSPGGGGGGSYTGVGGSGGNGRAIITVYRN